MSTRFRIGILFLCLVTVVVTGSILLALSNTDPSLLHQPFGAVVGAIAIAALTGILYGFVGSGRSEATGKKAKEGK